MGLGYNLFATVVPEVTKLLAARIQPSFLFVLHIKRFNDIVREKRLIGGHLLHFKRFQSLI